MNPQLPGILPPPPKPILRVLSLGGGVQSTTLAFLAAEGKTSHPLDLAIFADTGWEPPHVYTTIQAVRRLAPFPVVTTDRGRNLRDDVYNGVNYQDRPLVQIPIFLKYPDGKGMGRRQCTTNYKIVPIQRAIRAHLNIKRITAKTPIEQWLGITTDEWMRAKPDRNPNIHNRFPLLEENWTRQDCANYLADQHPDIPVGKSACIGCPYHSAETWQTIADQYPDHFADAVAVDHQLRTHNRRKGTPYLHSSLQPLDQAIKTHAPAPDGQGNECEGHCFL